MRGRTVWTGSRSVSLHENDTVTFTFDDVEGSDVRFRLLRWCLDCDVIFSLGPRCSSDHPWALRLVEDPEPDFITARNEDSRLNPQLAVHPQAEILSSGVNRDGSAWVEYRIPVERRSYGAP